MHIWLNHYPIWGSDIPSAMDQIDRLPHRITHDYKYLSRGDFDASSNASTKRNSVLSKNTTLVASSIAGSDGKTPEKPSKPSSLKPVKEDIPPEIKVTIKRHWTPASEEKLLDMYLNHRLYHSRSNHSANSCNKISQKVGIYLSYITLWQSN